MTHRGGNEMTIKSAAENELVHLIRQADDPGQAIVTAVQSADPHFDFNAARIISSAICC